MKSEKGDRLFEVNVNGFANRLDTVVDLTHFIADLVIIHGPDNGSTCPALDEPKFEMGVVRLVLRQLERMVAAFRTC
jgi:hypothetical protein